MDVCVCVCVMYVLHTHYTTCIRIWICINASLSKYKWQKYSQNTTIFISYERVDHIAVYNYMFRPLSAIVRLYYFLL